MLGLVELVKWVECFDISYMMGEVMVVLCVVFDVSGLVCS